MAKTNNVIELNGKKYDALTGALLGAPSTHITTVKPLVVKPTPSAGRNGSVDGMLTGHKPEHHAHIAVKKAPLSPRAAQQIAHHKPEHSKTLMRHAVKPPVIQKKTQVKTASPLAKAVPSKLAVKPKHSSEVVDPERSQRAHHVDRSQMVTRFRSPAVATAPKPLVPQPAVQKQTIQPQPAQPATLKVVHYPAQNRRQQAAQQRQLRGVQQDIRPVAQQPRPHSTAVRHQARPQQHVSKDIFETALANATSHEQQAPKESSTSKLRRGAKRRRKLVGAFASVVTFLLVAGFVAYQNKANIQLELASAKAGFQVNTPAYKPSGFSIGNVSYSPGTAAYAYTNKANNQSFSVTQKESNWDSQTLLDNYVATADGSYEGYQSNGRTIYVYGDGNATWVNGGVWYQLHATGPLDTEQLVKIAASI